MCACIILYHSICIIIWLIIILILMIGVNVVLEIVVLLHIILVITSGILTVDSFILLSQSILSHILSIVLLLCLLSNLLSMIELLYLFFLGLCQLLSFLIHFSFRSSLSLGFIWKFVRIISTKDSPQSFLFLWTRIYRVLSLLMTLFPCIYNGIYFKSLWFSSLLIFTCFNQSCPHRLFHWCQRWRCINYFCPFRPIFQLVFCLANLILPNNWLRVWFILLWSWPF